MSAYSEVSLSLSIDDNGAHPYTFYPCDDADMLNTAFISDVDDDERSECSSLMSEYSFISEYSIDENDVRLHHSNIELFDLNFSVTEHGFQND